MRIDSIFKDDSRQKIDKANYYLGLISYVSNQYNIVQVENLSLFEHRLLGKDYLLPNTINFYVVVGSSSGIFICNVIESGVKNSDNVHKALDAGRKEEVLPNLKIELIGFSENNSNGFELPGFNNLGVGDKVYVANNSVIIRFLEFIQHNSEYKDSGQDDNSEAKDSILNIGSYKMLPNYKFNITSNNLFNRHLMVIGATGSGKSTSSLTILSELINNNKKILIIDPTGEYSHSFKDGEIDKTKLGDDVYVDCENVSIPQWAIIFKTNSETQPSVLANAINVLRYQKSIGSDNCYVKDGKTNRCINDDLEKLSDGDLSFDLKLLGRQIRNNSVKENRNNVYKIDDFMLGANQFLINKVEYAINNAGLTEFFTPNGSSVDLFSKIKEFMENKIHSLYINASQLSKFDEIGSVIIDLVANYLLDNLEVNSKHPFTLFIDEVHRYSNKTILGEKVLTGLENVAREGRKLGVYLFLTTQSPLDVPDVLLSQVGTLLVHRLTHSTQIDSIRNYLDYNTYSRIKKLRTGEAILSSVNLIQEVDLTISKCNRTHHNDSPIY